MARLKFGTSDTTKSGWVLCQWRRSRAVKDLWLRRMSACKTFNSCPNPKVQPRASRAL